MPTTVLDSNVLIASRDRNEITYLYSFDDDFDAPDSVTRLQTDANPFGL